MFAIMVVVGNSQETHSTTDTGHSATDATHTPAPAGKSHGLSQVHGSSSHIAHADKTRGGIFIMFCLAVGVITQVLLKHLRLPYTVVLLILGIIFGLWEKHEKIHGVGILGDSMEVWAEIDPHVFLFIFLPALLYEVQCFFTPEISHDSAM
jgi:hypothetical protein